ncbi:MAG TPA: hypothetical protein VGB82_01420 [Alphaproteobacteria bacterium]
MAHHTVTHYLGGTVPVVGDFFLDAHGGLDLAGASIMGLQIAELSSIGEWLPDPALPLVPLVGRWHSLERILTDKAIAVLDEWMSEEMAHDRELARS